MVKKEKDKSDKLENLDAKQAESDSLVSKDVAPSTQEESSSIQKILEQAISQPLENYALEDTKNKATPDEVKKFIRSISVSFAIGEDVAFVGAALLFLKGAANKNSPGTMGVDVLDESGSPVFLTKYDLQIACQQACKNRLLRRIARSLAREIGIFAEKNHLNGDLAIKLNNNLLAEEESPLTSKEKAWASSFSQTISNLEEFCGPRVPSLLAKDYNRRFADSKPKKSNNQQNNGKSNNQQNNDAPQQGGAQKNQKPNKKGQKPAAPAAGKKGKKSR